MKIALSTTHAKTLSEIVCLLRPHSKISEYGAAPEKGSIGTLNLIETLAYIYV